MRPGPGGPYNGRGMRMMGPGPTRQGHSPFGGSFMGPGGPSHPRMNPLMGARQPARQGGILARILGKGQGAAGFPSFGGSTQGATRAAGSGGGLLNALTNPSSINGFLNNTQQVLKTAQQVGPMIQQYGPLVKNLPAMWKLYRGLKDIPNEEEEQEVDSTANESKPSTDKNRENKSTAKPKRRTTSTTSKAEESKRKTVTRNSTPKLFI
jgi:hypothetical protein